MKNTYVKRRGYETQRSKPWHIVKPGSTKEDVLCGAYRSWIKAVAQNPDSWYATRIVPVDELPEGQIVCSICERIQSGIPPFKKKEKS